VLEDPKKGATCSFVDSDGEKCERKHFCRGYCTQHYGKHILVPCPACVRGKELLKARGISLAHRWTEPDVAAAVARLRWNDGQLKPFLRSWRRQNIVQNTPLYVMREANKDGIPAGVDAGLLKYAEMVINHEVVNDFKRISRGDDMSMMVFNKGLSPDMGDDETVAWESDDMSDDPSARQRVFRDVTAHIRYEEMETHRDLAAIVAAAGLTSEESEVIQALDIQEMTVREYADLHGKNIQRVNRVRVSAFRKLRDHRAVVSQTISDLDQLMRDVCEKHGCTPEQVLGPDSFGPAVRARTDLCTSLSDAGLPLSDISSRLGLSEARVAAALNRSVLRDMRRPTV
jgi:DNA-directed RNA polymerase specialized sigma24 family protein